MSTRCSGCGRGIAGKPGDPVHALSAGIFCTACLRDGKAAPAARAPGRTRAEASAARWAAMTPEQKAERVAKLQAGRPVRAEGARPVRQPRRKVEATDEPSTGRSGAARARWAAMSPEQKAERVAKLQAGRKAREAAHA